MNELHCCRAHIYKRSELYFRNVDSAATDPSTLCKQISQLIFAVHTHGHTVLSSPMLGSAQLSPCQLSRPSHVNVMINYHIVGEFPFSRAKWLPKRESTVTRKRRNGRKRSVRERGSPLSWASTCSRDTACSMSTVTSAGYGAGHGYFMYACVYAGI